MSERSHSRTPPADRRQARGIRGGKAARRKREAYLRHEVAQGRSLEEIPVARPGGQQRPLGTTRFWDPEDLDSASRRLSRRSKNHLQHLHLVHRCRSPLDS